MTSSSVPHWVWPAFGVLVLVLLGVDLLAHRHGRVDSRNRAIVWSAGWICAALLFNVGVAFVLGADAAEEFFSAYLVEKSLSVDNLFVFMLVFGRLRVPSSEERHVLTWGILGALVTRGVCIALGAALLERWHAITYVFGGILIVSAARMLRKPAAEPGEKGRVLTWLERHVPYTPELQGSHFLVREGGRRLATPLLLALITIELTDVVFAVDSIPAAFAVTDRPFIVYSSNVFAIFGLRSLYVVLARAIQGLKYLHFGLAAILLFAGGKMVLAPWIHVPPTVSLAVISACAAVAIFASLRARRLHRMVTSDSRPRRSSA